MAERIICRGLLETQQQTIAFFVESIKKEISANSKLAQSLLEQASGAASRSLQEQVEGLIVKEKGNACKLSALEEIQNKTMTIAEEQQYLIEEAQLRLQTPQTPAVESASQTEIMVGLYPKLFKGSQSGPHRRKLLQPVKPCRIRKSKHMLHC